MLSGSLRQLEDVEQWTNYVDPGSDPGDPNPLRRS